MYKSTNVRKIEVLNMQGTIHVLRKYLLGGWEGWLKDGNISLLAVLKICLRSGEGGPKSLKMCLRNI